MSKVAFILNPISGAGHKSGVVEYIKEVLPRYPEIEWEFYWTKCAGDAYVAAKRFAEQGFSLVVAIGGDGTVNEVARGLVGTNAKLGIVPQGSGNGLARHLGIPIGYHNAVNLLFEGKPLAIDAGKINGEFFFCTAGVGFDAVVGEKFNNSSSRGLATYMEHCAKEYVKYQPQEYEIDILGAKFKQKAFLITFANSSQWGNNVFIAPDANISDGMMDVVIWRDSPMVTMPWITAELILKKIKYSEFVDTYRCREVVIRRAKEGVIHLDGESMVMGEELRVSVVHNALEVIVPDQTRTFLQMLEMMPQQLKEKLPPQFWELLEQQLKGLSPQQLKEKVPQQLKDIVPRIKDMVK